MFFIWDAGRVELVSNDHLNILSFNKFFDRGSRGRFWIFGFLFSRLFELYNFVTYSHREITHYKYEALVWQFKTFKEKISLVSTSSAIST